VSAKKPAAVELPAEVVYHNLWTGFDSKPVGRLFECIPLGELAKLEEGATIWLDAEQPSGKVYGFDRAEVVSVKDTKTHIGIMFKGPRTEGGVSVEKKDGWHKVHRCTDPAKLVRLIKKNPLAIETGTVGTISDTSREYLERIGAVLVAA
jgi:hypothetical protein